jgi:hypothetical protein
MKINQVEHRTNPRAPRLDQLDALAEHPYGAVLVLPAPEVLELGEVLLEPMLPEELEPMSLGEAGLAAEFGLAAELAEPLTGPEGEVALLPLSVAEPLLGLVALFDPMLLLELPAVEPVAPESWANAIGANAATDRARPAPSK